MKTYFGWWSEKAFQQKKVGSVHELIDGTGTVNITHLSVTSEHGIDEYDDIVFVGMITLSGVGFVFPMSDREVVWSEAKDLAINPMISDSKPSEEEVPAVCQFRYYGIGKCTCNSKECYRPGSQSSNKGNVFGY
jgi:hypothetical protein